MLQTTYRSEKCNLGNNLLPTSESLKSVTGRFNGRAVVRLSSEIDGNISFSLIPEQLELTMWQKILVFLGFLEKPESSEQFCLKNVETKLLLLDLLSKKLNERDCKALIEKNSWKTKWSEPIYLDDMIQINSQAERLYRKSLPLFDTKELDKITCKLNTHTKN